VGVEATERARDVQERLQRAVPPALIWIVTLYVVAACSREHHLVVRSGVRREDALAGTHHAPVESWTWTVEWWRRWCRARAPRSGCSPGFR